MPSDANELPHEAVLLPDQQGPAQIWGDRAQFMVGPLRAFLDPIGRSFFDRMFARTANEQISTALEQADAATDAYHSEGTSPDLLTQLDQLTPIRQAYLVMREAAGALINDDPFGPEHLRMVERLIGSRATYTTMNEPSNLAGGMRMYTLQQHVGPILREATGTVCNFPLNLLASVVLAQGPGGPIRIQSLQDVAGALQSPWFARMMSRAASLPNRQWESTTNRPIPQLSAGGESSPPSANAAKLLEFVFSETANGAATCDFSPRVRARMLMLRAMHNRRAVGHDHELTDMGTSAGCPLGGLQPVGISRDDTRYIAGVVGASMKQVLARKETTGITHIVQSMAALISRAAGIAGT